MMFYRSQRTRRAEKACWWLCLVPPAMALASIALNLVNGVTSAVPETLLTRLSPGGRLVGALRIEGIARRVVVSRLDDSQFDHATGPVVRLPPLIPGRSQAL